MQNTSKYLFGLSATNGRLKKKKVLTWYSRLKAKLKFQITSASLQNKLHCHIGEMLPRFLCSSVIVMTSRSPSSEP